MVVKLEEIYSKLYPKYGVKLCTESCFDKTISWMHILEEVEFVSMLRGGELILKSEYETDEWLKKYIELLDMANAGGLIVALRTGRTISKDIIEYCNHIEFPLFSAAWKISYMDIMHLISSVLLKNEQKEANQITALKKAIQDPENTDAYQTCFEEMGFSKSAGYFIVMLGLRSYDAENGSTQMEKIEKSLRYAISGSVIYEENGILIILATGFRKNEIKQQVRELSEKDDNVCAGMGSVVQRICDVHRSYETSNMAYQLARLGLQRILDYSEMGIYKILSDVKDSSVYPDFVEDTLGSLLRYDEENGTDYVQILQTFFANECSSIQTAAALYFHKNTMTYKLNKIREILGYDILKNENRMRIMVSFYIISMGKEYFS